MIALVAAMGRSRVIGKDGKMPWHLPADLRHFRRLTKGHIVVMGRKTYESIGGALSGRTNWVLTRDTAYQAPGCEVLHSLEPVLREERPVFVIGGAELYRAFLPYADTLHLTMIDADVEGDTYFPTWDPDEWALTDSLPRAADEKNAYACEFQTYQRTRPKA
ncbi:MAG TPA: dihydrofolate reductase [Symbiobacteriaceae bacterium]|nr:dihydrofolate reductase [Symbiobacteriaceae bacterium]